MTARVHCPSAPPEDVPVMVHGRVMGSSGGANYVEPVIGRMCCQRGEWLWYRAALSVLTWDDEELHIDGWAPAPAHRRPIALRQEASA